MLENDWMAKRVDARDLPDPGLYTKRSRYEQASS
jgi:hypothetical protein